MVKLRIRRQYNQPLPMTANFLLKSFIFLLNTNCNLLKIRKKHKYKTSFVQDTMSYSCAIFIQLAQTKSELGQFEMDSRQRRLEVRFIVILQRASSVHRSFILTLSLKIQPIKKNLINTPKNRGNPMS
jgi:hypothetical protein